MNGVKWATVMDRALREHDDAPTVEQVCAIAVKVAPGEWDWPGRSILPIVAAAELRETMKQVAYLKADGGPSAGLRVHEIRAAACKTLYRRAHYTEVGKPYVNAGASHPALLAEAEV